MVFMVIIVACIIVSIILLVLVSAVRDPHKSNMSITLDAINYV